MAVPALLVLPAAKVIGGFIVKAAAKKLLLMKGQALTAWATGGLWGLVKLGFSKLVKKVSFSQINSWLWQAKDAIWNFNWNITDEQIDAQIKSSLKMLANYTGAALGQTIGWVGCGVGGTAALGVFNPAAAAYVLQQAAQGEGITEEALEEISQAWAFVLQAGVRAIASSAFLWGYKSIRKLLKSDKLRPLTERVLGKQRLDAWGAADAPTVSLRGLADKALDWLIPIDWLREAVEEMLEEAEEACREATFLIAAEADAFLAQAATRAATVAMGEQRTVEITPNREFEDETIVLSGRQNVLIPTATAVLAHHQLIETRDIGDVVGMPREQYERRAVHETSLVLKWTSSPRPPFRRRGDEYHESTINVPMINRQKLDWMKIKQAMGNQTGFRTGRHKLTGLLSNGSGWCVYGETRQQCEQLTRELLYFSKAELVTKNFGYEDETTSRNRQLRNLKWIGTLYPHSFTLLHTQVDEQGSARVLDSRAQLTRMSRNQWKLWFDSPPRDFEQELNKIFRRPATPTTPGATPRA
ncbi:hypothetical protein QQ056_09405 [Oscillatoria laete-virens NRMC-F 0139]|nr:hypothetical protein [Oscillatoria laete-virens]MDL5053759.1 hypothetical protein [Oscillatoria laete-virens NRMC-F 0139]